METATAVPAFAFEKAALTEPEILELSPVNRPSMVGTPLRVTVVVPS